MRARGVQIVGGGLAGLALGIALRQTNAPATVWEAGQYPRHRVCGEVLSGEGIQVLERLGLSGHALGRHARLATTAAFFTPQRQSPLMTLPSPALCISRYQLDALLAERFSALRGELRTGAKWLDPGPDPAGVVRASGRLLQPVDSGWRWLGLKAHAAHVSLAADVEMHFHDGGYVGLSRLPQGTTNICGLFRRPATRSDPAPSWEAALRGPHGSILHERLSSAVWDVDSVCGVAAVSLRPRRAAEADGCRIGDALTMISPVTGNGMSMALQAGELAAGCLSAYSNGKLDWDEARSGIAQATDALFADRLRWARRLHQLLFSELGRFALMQAVSCRWIWQRLFACTR